MQNEIYKKIEEKEKRNLKVSRYEGRTHDLRIYAESLVTRHPPVNEKEKLNRKAKKWDDFPETF